MSDSYLKLKVMMVRAYMVVALFSISYSVYLTNKGTDSYISNPIVYAFGAIAMALITCTCLYLIHKTLFTADK